MSCLVYRAWKGTQVRVMRVREPRLVTPFPAMCRSWNGHERASGKSEVHVQRNKQQAQWKGERKQLLCWQEQRKDGRRDKEGRGNLCVGNRRKEQSDERRPGRSTRREGRGVQGRTVGKIRGAQKEDRGIGKVCGFRSTLGIGPCWTQGRIGNSKSQDKGGENRWW